jgi:hypothetical protein
MTEVRVHTREDLDRAHAVLRWFSEQETRSEMFGVRIRSRDEIERLREEARVVLRSFADWLSSPSVGLSGSEVAQTVWTSWAQVEMGDVWVADDGDATFSAAGGYAVIGPLRDDGLRVASFGGSPGSAGIDYVGTVDGRWLCREDCLSPEEEDLVERALSGSASGSASSGLDSSGLDSEEV